MWQFEGLILIWRFWFDHDVFTKENSDKIVILYANFTQVCAKCSDEILWKMINAIRTRRIVSLRAEYFVAIVIRDRLWIEYPIFVPQFIQMNCFCCLFRSGRYSEKPFPCYNDTKCHWCGYSDYGDYVAILQLP